MLPIRLSCLGSPRWPHPGSGTEAHWSGGGPRSQETGGEHCHGHAVPVPPPQSPVGSCRASACIWLASLTQPGILWPLRKRGSADPSMVSSAPSLDGHIEAQAFPPLPPPPALCVLAECLSGPAFPSLFRRRGGGLVSSILPTRSLFKKLGDADPREKDTYSS